MSQKPVQLGDQYKLRLPEGMRDAIWKSSVANKRSMNAEIISRLEHSFSNDSKLDQIIAKLDRLLPPD